MVTTDKGQVLGETRENGTVQFRSIPFAAAPVGEWRYQPPQPKAAWQDVLDARAPVTRCMQQYPWIWPDWPGDQSEDCLWLSVTTPALDQQKRPVIAWVHGGGLFFGGGGEGTYDGANLAKRGDVVVINLQYRLASYGWLDLSEFGEDKGAPTHAEQDLIAGLQWIKNNIAQFGGDPDNVTIMGESGGSMAVASLLRREAADDLYHKVILQSAVFFRVN